MPKEKTIPKLAHANQQRMMDVFPHSRYSAGAASNETKSAFEVAKSPAKSPVKLGKPAGPARRVDGRTVYD